MKRKLTKIWGIGLTLVLLVSLLAFAAPVSAAPLEFSPETIPSGTDQVIINGSNVLDIAVAADGTTVYAVTGTGNVYKSTDAGVSWTVKTTAAGHASGVIGGADLIAVAPDDANYAVVAKADATTTVYATTNGGATWGVLGTPQEGSDAAAAVITDIALSADSAGTHYIAIAGSDTDNVGNVWYFDLGAAAPSWVEINDKTGFSTSDIDLALAVAFSPNFASDQVLTAVTSDNGTAVYFEMFSMSTLLWNVDAGFTNYEVELLNSAGASFDTVATVASISLSPTYLGGDEIERVAFVGITGGSDDDGVYRLDNTTVRHLTSAADINSVAFNGTNLVAAVSAATTIYRSADPLVSLPTFIPTASTKSPGGASLPVVAWAGTSVVAGTSGDASAFSVSTDDGASWNDISLIDTAITEIEDVAVSADGSVTYLLANDGSDMSLFRRASSWQRVLNISGDTGYIVRIAPDDPSVVYVADKAGTTVYYSKESGDTKWYTRASRYSIQDLAVESADVAYVAVDGAVTVSKTTNRGFTWGVAGSTELIAGSIHTITSLSEDNLIVGGTTGYVSYSTDGGATWTPIAQQINTTSLLTQVTASGLAEGDFIYAASSENTTTVERWPIGQSQAVPWKDLLAPTSTDYRAYGIALHNGTLYVSTTYDGGATEVQRTLIPFIDEPSAAYWTTMTAAAGDFDRTPSALRVSGVTVYGASAGVLWGYADLLAAAGPELIGPADGMKLSMNPISGTAYDVSFTWKRPSLATDYYLWVAFDEAFTETAIGPGRLTGSTTDATVSEILGAGVSDTLSYMPGTTYYWRVMAAVPIASPWSEVRSFSVEPGTAVVPAIGSPANGETSASATPAFSWSPVSGATRYEFQLSADAGFTLPLLASTKLTSTGIQPAGTLDAGATYFWRVRSLEPVAGGWSTIANFTVAVPVEPAAPVVIPPAKAPVVNIPPIEVPAPIVNIPPAPTPTAPISQGLLLAIIIIGAVLVIAVIVLIVRTRRTV